MKIKISLSFLFLIITANLYSQDSLKQPPKKIKELGKNLYEITLEPCNIIASIGPDGVLIVDANYKEYRKFMIAEINNLGGSKINYIINTHWHYDHAGGNLVLGDDNTVIIAHNEVKKLLSKDQILMGDTIKAHPENRLPRITFEDKYNLDFNGEKIELIALSGGHSAGDIIVYFKNAKVAHIGDIVFADMFSFIDYEHGGSVYTLERNLQKIIDILPADVQIIPGHGRAYSIEDLKKYKDMVSSTSEIVKKEIKNGKSHEEIKKANVLKDWKEWEGAFSCNDWIDYICNSR